MPDLEVRGAPGGVRREGRRSHAAYGSHARGIRLVVGSDRVVRVLRTRVQHGPHAAADARAVGAWSAGIALALVYPLMRRAHRAAILRRGTEAADREAAAT